MWEDISAVAEAHGPRRFGLFHRQVLAVALQEEFVVEFFGDRPGGALDGAKVPHPAILGQFAFELDDDVVVVPVERLAAAAKGGHVGGGEPQPVSFDGNAAGNVHASNRNGPLPTVAAPGTRLVGTCAVRHNRLWRERAEDTIVALIYVTSSNPGEGKTGVAAAIASQLAYSGTPVRLVRLEDAQGSAAAEDAAWFAGLDFAPGSPAGLQAAAPGAAEGETLVIEGPLSGAPADAKVVLVARDQKPASTPPGTVAIVVTDVDGLAGIRATAGAPLLVEVGEDRTLAGFSISEVTAALNVEVLVQGDGGDPTSDHLVIAPIGSDAGQPYFRRFDSKAVVVRFDKTDQHLAAIKGQPNLLILTGGRRPSDYLFDAAGANGIPVLLSRTDTENTVIALEGIFDRTRFHGERKLERMAELLDGSGLAEALA